MTKSFRTAALRWPIMSSAMLAQGVPSSSRHKLLPTDFIYCLTSLDVCSPAWSPIKTLGTPISLQKRRIACLTCAFDCRGYAAINPRSVVKICAHVFPLIDLPPLLVANIVSINK